jgi:hypothetical protein
VNSDGQSFDAKLKKLVIFITFSSVDGYFPIHKSVIFQRKSPIKLFSLAVFLISKNLF